MAGRPKAKIDWKIVDKYLQAQCDGVGIASLLGIHYNTLFQACEQEHKCKFSEYSQQKKSEGKELLRATMFKNAMNGDKSLQIWLSKQYLGMRETPLEENVQKHEPHPIVINFVKPQDV